MKKCPYCKCPIDNKGYCDSIYKTSNNTLKHSFSVKYNTLLLFLYLDDASMGSLFESFVKFIFRDSKNEYDVILHTNNINYGLTLKSIKNLNKKEINKIINLITLLK